MIREIEFTYETTDSKSYIVYQMEIGNSLDRVEIEMLRHNRIDGIMSPGILQKNSILEFRYDITSKTNLLGVIKEKVTREKLFRIFESICITLEEAEDYLLDIEHLIAKPEYMFIDLSDGKISFVLLPIISKEVPQISLLSFLKNILASIVYDTGSNTDFYVQMLNYLNNVEVVTPKKFREKLYESLHIIPSEEKEKKPEDLAAIHPKKTEVSDTNVQIEMENSFSSKKMKNFVEMPKEKKEKKSFFRRSVDEGHKKERKSVESYGMDIPGMEVPGMERTESKEDKAADKKYVQEVSEIAVEQPDITAEKAAKKKSFWGIGKKKQEMPVVRENVAQMSVVKQNISKENVSEENVLYAMENTVLLDDVVSMEPYLEHEVTGEVIKIHKSPYSLGRNPEYVDYVINKPTVGRKHLEITVDNGKVYVRDNNSRNGTYINQDRINSNEAYELQEGDHLKIGTERYTFHH